jgi:FkbM family methyltransferase
MKILDIGANNGEFAKKLCKPGSFVVAIEASPIQNPNLDGYNIIWENKAVSDSCTPVILHISTCDTLNTINPNWISQGRFANHSTGKTILVDATTIDLLWDKYDGFDHIKIDVEGYENVVLSGM